jgi:two-component system response regulator FixJ
MADELTAREREVLARVASGYSSKAVARELGISARTVEVHRAHIKAKLQARNAGDVVRVAMTLQLVDPPSPAATQKP